MQKRYLPIAIATGILFVMALIGYLVPAQSDGPPIRILLENKGGKVLFGHQEHVDIEDKNCVTCHHTSGNDQSPATCGSCHARKFDKTFIASHQNDMDEKNCASCHHNPATTDKFSHALHAEDYTDQDCQACHHDASIEPEPQSCSDCHGPEAAKEVPSLKDANHTRCASCHEDMYQQGVTGCRNCHTRQQDTAQKPEYKSCSSCHTTPTNELVPTRSKAFHGQCMGCHEKQEAGPFGDDSCYKCHMK